MLNVAMLLAASYAAVLGVGRLTYRSALYPAPRRGLHEAPAGGELVERTASDGQRVQCARYVAPDARGTIVFFHGNGESIADSVALGQMLRARGVTFVAVEYRGYGTSPSEHPSEAGLYADAEAALVAEASAALTLWGSSLGSGIAVEMATRGHAARLILQAPYTSIPAVAQRWLPILPMSLLIGDRFDNLAKAPAVRVPTLIIHGDDDAVVPHDMGKTLAKAIAGAELLTIAGAGHNDLFARDRDRIIDAIVAHATR
jgi:hypothetical protein